MEVYELREGEKREGWGTITLVMKGVSHFAGKSVQ